MSECPKLKYVSSGFFSETKYKCELTGIEMYADDTKCKHLCKCDDKDEYENCPVYKDR